MSHRKRYRISLIIILFMTLAAIPMVFLVTVNNRIPDQLTLYINESEELNFNAPFEAVPEEKDEQVFSTGNGGGGEAIHFDFSQPVKLSVSNAGKYKMTLKLFGVIPYKSMEVRAVESSRVIPGGDTVGIYVETKGVMVLGTGSVTGKDGISYEPAANIMKSGDYITALGKTEIQRIEQVKDYMEQVTDDEVVATVVRNGETQELKLKTILSEDGTRKLGIWLRDDTQGIGTLTYATPDGSYGALGHGISDESTGLLIDVNGGKLLDSDVISIVKGMSGEPGEMVGLIHNSDSSRFGTIEKNTETGIFGKLDTEKAQIGKTIYAREAVPVGHKQEVKEGKASILCQLDGEITNYEIEIDKIKWNAKTASKGMEIRITDERLLNKTNGIIQGMSGSPILQNGKLIGAVTHVFVQDSTRGYGIFIENMLTYAK